jgi:hypothetical protein
MIEQLQYLLAGDPASLKISTEKIGVPPGPAADLFQDAIWEHLGTKTSHNHVPWRSIRQDESTGY